MSKKMLLESDPHQERVAVLESDRLTEIYVERRDHRGSVGNIYKGRVTRVLPGMQAAFVDIGLERDAFLYVSDVVEVEEGDDSSPEETADAELPREMRSIDELLQADQEVLVQVTKDALGTKGARVTTNITLPSRHLVLLPTMAHLGVSRRIEDEAERQRLRGVLEQFDQTEFGLIVRTAGEGKDAADFRPDFDYLRAAWERVVAQVGRVAAPSLVHRDLDLALRVVRDQLNDDFSVLWVDRQETYERIVEFLGIHRSELAGKVRLDNRDGGLFERFGVEQEIEAALSSKVWLKSGGYLVINQTEALVAIDVNTGRYVGRDSLEDTVLRTNLEAVGEIVRQIRLRDLSGILIIDLIDMSSEEHRAEVFAAFEEELKKDRAKSKVSQISEFGLIEVTRKRSHSNLERLLTRRCPYCGGRGRIKTIRTICLDIRAEVLHFVHHGAHLGDLLVRAHPDVASALQHAEGAILEELQSLVGSNILVQADPALHQERFDLSEL